MSYLKLGKKGAELLTGGDQNMLEGDLSGGYYIQPTIFKGHNKMRFFKRKFSDPF
jgi:aldehyde dehydrogenase